MTAWTEHIPELTHAQRDLLSVLRGAIEEREPDSPPTDWQAVFDLAVLQQVSDFLYPRVRTWQPPNAPPATVAVPWRSAFLRAATRYTHAAIQVRDLLQALVAAGIPVIPLKGCWLAERIYEDGACRPMVDVDLLVPPDALERARVEVARLGYTTHDPYMLEPSVRERNCHVRYQRAASPLHLELHWGLWHPGVDTVDEPDPEHPWTDLRDDVLHGVPVRVFSPERQLVFMARHVLHHTFSMPMRAYLDIGLLARRHGPTLDAVRLADEALAWRVPLGARFVTQVAAGICGGDLAPPLVDFVAPVTEYEEARRAALRAAVQLTVRSSRMTPTVESFYRASRFRRLLIGLGRLVVSPAHLRVHYSGAVRRFGLVGGYVCRIADVIRRHGHALAKRDTEPSPDVAAAIENFDTRTSLTAWIHEGESTWGR